MKAEKIVNAIGEIDERLVSEALVHPVRRRSLLPPVVAVVLCVTVAMVIFGVLGRTDPISPRDETVSDEVDVPHTLSDDRYGDFTVLRGEMGYVFGKDELTECEKYSLLSFDGNSFRTRSREIGKEYISEKLGVGEGTGTGIFDTETYTAKLDVYSVCGVSSDYIVAAKVDDVYCVYLRDDVDMPSTFGELYEAFGMRETLHLERFSNNGDSLSPRALDSDDEIRKLLCACGDSENVKRAETAGDVESVSFSVSSEQLGVYKRTLTVYANGYLSTNILDCEATYRIGETAEKIIKYARENSESAKYEPYLPSALGYVTEVADDYIMIDDSSLCRDENDGVTYTIMLDDIRISRYVKRVSPKVGELIMAEYEQGGMTDEFVITNAVNLSRASFVDGYAAVEE